MRSLILYEMQQKFYFEKKSQYTHFILCIGMYLIDSIIDLVWSQVYAVHTSAIYKKYYILMCYWRNGSNFIYLSTPISPQMWYLDIWILLFNLIICLSQIPRQVQDSTCLWKECNGCVPKTAWSPPETVGWGGTGQAEWLSKWKGKFFPMLHFCQELLLLNWGRMWCLYVSSENCQIGRKKKLHSTCTLIPFAVGILLRT